MSDADGACINPQLTGQNTSGATASGTVTASCRCSNSTAEDATAAPDDVNPVTSGGSSTAATLSAVTSPTALWPPHGIGGEGGGGGSDEGLSKRIEEMEEEQEELTNSLMEMTSHFAKVLFVCLLGYLKKFLLISFTYFVGVHWLVFLFKSI